MQPEIVWDGREELTHWPLTDWIVFRRDSGYQPIWDRRPMTSSMLWERWMARSNDGAGSFEHTTATMNNVDAMDRMEAQWAKIKSLIPFAPKPEVLPVPVMAAAELPSKASADEALKELALVESIQPDIARAFCVTTNKVKHDSKLWALHHRNRLANMPDEYHPEQLATYKCKWCGSWHVGHKT